MTVLCNGPSWLVNTLAVSFLLPSVCHGLFSEITLYVFWSKASRVIQSSCLSLFSFFFPFFGSKWNSTHLFQLLHTTTSFLASALLIQVWSVDRSQTCLQRYSFFYDFYKILVSATVVVFPSVNQHTRFSFFLESSFEVVLVVLDFFSLVYIVLIFLLHLPLLQPELSLPLNRIELCHCQE